MSKFLDLSAVFDCVEHLTFGGQDDNLRFLRLQSNPDDELISNKEPVSNNW